MYFFYFYPLGLDRPTSRPPLLTFSMSMVMVITFLWSRYFPMQFSFSPDELIFYLGNGAPWTVVTAVFMHGGWFHILGNLLYLKVLGPPLEQRLGPGKFLFLFLMMGAFGNMVHGLFSVLGWLGQAGVGVLGASGAIAGLLGFSLIRLHASRIEIAWWVFAPIMGQNRAGKNYIPLTVGVALWLFMQIIQSMVATQTGASVSFGAHFGGFAMGLMLALLLGQWTPGKAEAKAGQAREYLRQGHFHAAVGAWTEFLELVPGDTESMLCLARSMRLSGQLQQASKMYFRVFSKLMQSGKADRALEVYVEARRSGAERYFGPDELAKVAYYCEKQSDYLGAVEAFKSLYLAFPGHSHGQRALVRIIALYEGKLQDREGGRAWRLEAEQSLPSGHWRSYLELDPIEAREPGAVSLASPLAKHQVPTL